MADLLTTANLVSFATLTALEIVLGVDNVIFISSLPGTDRGLSGQDLILLIDVIFSLDSVITAVGLADDLRVKIAAILVAAVVMVVFAGSIASFVVELINLRVRRSTAPVQLHNTPDPGALG